LTQFEKHKNYNVELTLDSGEKFRIYANWIHNNTLDHFQGWHCEAGHTRFYIDKYYNIWDGMCCNKMLGNVLGDWELVYDNVCQKPTCTGCTDDLVATKYKK